MFFFVKKKTAYERRISDWSSDVCSSDLRRDGLRTGDREPGADARALVDGLRLAELAGEAGQHLEQVGRDLGDEVGFLPHDGDLLLDLARVVGADRKSVV